MLVIVVQSVTCFDCGGDSPLLQCVNSANGYYVLSNVPCIHKLYLPLLQRYR